MQSVKGTLNFVIDHLIQYSKILNGDLNMIFRDLLVLHEGSSLKNLPKTFPEIMENNLSKYINLH